MKMKVQLSYNLLWECLQKKILCYLGMARCCYQVLQWSDMLKWNWNQTLVSLTQTDSWKWSCHLLICFHSPPVGLLVSCPSVSVAITHFPFICHSDRQLAGQSHTVSPSLITCLCLTSLVHSHPLSIYLLLLAAVFLTSFSCSHLCFSVSVHKCRVH